MQEGINTATKERSPIERAFDELEKQINILEDSVASNLSRLQPVLGSEHPVDCGSNPDNKSVDMCSDYVKRMAVYASRIQQANRTIVYTLERCEI